MFKRNPINRIVCNSAFLLVAFTLLSRITGFLREVLLAYFYGAGIISDAYVMAKTIPEVILASLITSVGVAYMPVFSKILEQHGKREADCFTTQLAFVMVLVSTFTIIMGEVFSKYIVKLFAPGFSEDAIELTDYFLKMTLCMIVGFMLVSIFSAYIQYTKSIIVPAAIGIVQSASVIVFVFLSVKFGYKLLALGIVVGYSMQALLCIVYSVKTGYVPHFAKKMHAGTKEVIKLTIPVFIGSEAVQINSFVDKMLASKLDSGSVSALNYGHLVYNFLSIIAITIVTTAAYPKLNKAFSKNDLINVKNIAEKSILLMLIITIPLCGGCAFYSKDIISLIYERGAFTYEMTCETASIFMFYSLGLVFFAIDTIYTKLFYTVQNMKTSMFCSLLMVLLNIVLDIAFAGWFGVQGLALATSIATIIGSIIRILVFEKMYDYLKIVLPYKKTIRIVVGTFMSLLSSRMIYNRLISIYSSNICFIICFIIAVVIYIGIFNLLKISDIKSMISIFNKEE